MFLGRDFSLLNILRILFEIFLLELTHSVTLRTISSLYRRIVGIHDIYHIRIE